MVILIADHDPTQMVLQELDILIDPSQEFAAN